MNPDPGLDLGENCSDLQRNDVFEGACEGEQGCELQELQEGFRLLAFGNTELQDLYYCSHTFQVDWDEHEHENWNWDVDGL